MEDFNMPSTGKIIGYTVLFFIILFLLAVIGSATNLITIPWLKFDKQVQMNRDIVTKTYNADNALYNYHWFQETAGDITALKQNIDESKQSLAEFEASAGARSTWGFQEQEEDSQLRTVVLGQQQQYNSLVQNYNAKAGEADKSMFVNGLPTFFSLNAY